ncbi:MAG TPA: hypothetical protein VIW95_09085 [Candidatus Binatus sp.]
MEVFDRACLRTTVPQPFELQFERGAQAVVALPACNRIAAKPSLQLEEVEGEQTVREAARGDVRMKFAARLRLLDKVGDPAEHRRHHFGHAVTAIFDERKFSHEYAGQAAIALVQRDHRSKQVQHLIEQWPRGHRRKRVIDDAADLIAEEQHQEILLGAGIEEQGAGADIGGGGDFARGGSLEAFAAEEFSCSAFNPIELVAFAAFNPAWTFVPHFHFELSTLSYEHAHQLLRFARSVKRIR